MRDNGHRLTLVCQGFKFPHHDAGTFQIERCRGFVTQHQVRIGNQGPGYSHPLLLTAAQVIRQVFHAVAHAYFFQRGDCYFFGGSFAFAFQNKRHHDIFQRGKWRDQVKPLKNKADFFQPQFREFFFTEIVDFNIIDPDFAVTRVNDTSKEENSVVLPDPEGPIMSRSSPAFSSTVLGLRAMIFVSPAMYSLPALITFATTFWGVDSPVFVWVFISSDMDQAAGRNNLGTRHKGSKNICSMALAPYMLIMPEYGFVR